MGFDATSYSYDQNGNTTQQTNGASITKYIYNSRDRLERVELPDGRIATYTYDPFGRRIKKDVAGDVTYFAYSDEGLIGEYDASGSVKKTYGWMPDNIWGTDPVFMVENGQYYYHHNDHLGTPQTMTDISGNIVWTAEYTAFGEAIVDESSTITNNLRFPGQYYDEETGLHYNYQRYYDPMAGRYTQVDPIGFSARDENLYRYVGNNAAKYIDPEGEFMLVFEYNQTAQYGSKALVWNGWLPDGIFDMKTRADSNGKNAAAVSGIYKYKLGRHKGHGFPEHDALIIEDNQAIKTEEPNKVHGGKCVVDHAHAHGGNFKKICNIGVTGSEGCWTVPTVLASDEDAMEKYDPQDTTTWKNYNDFISSFKEHPTGHAVLIRLSVLTDLLRGSSMDSQMIAH